MRCWRAYRVEEATFHRILEKTRLLSDNTTVRAFLREKDRKKGWSGVPCLQESGVVVRFSYRSSNYSFPSIFLIVVVTGKTAMRI